MKTIVSALQLHHHRKHFIWAAALIVVLAICFASFFVVSKAFAQATSSQASNTHLITVYDRGSSKGILTDADTLREAFIEAGIQIDDKDLVEPGLDEPLEAESYDVNIYRARLVTIVDGAAQYRVVTAYQTPSQIAKEAGISLRAEDTTTLRASADPLSDGAGLVLSIDRATAFYFTFYGKSQTVYTQAATVGEMLVEKGITMGKSDDIDVALDTPITTGMKIHLWRNGAQTITVEETVGFPVKQVEDADQPLGYSKIQTAGTKGKKMVTYQIVMKNGKEVSRKAINSVVTKKPVEQVEIIGVKSGGGLTKSKGVYYFTDSRGVTHRETYYDLRMNVVMGNCGGGTYTIRADGAKVDADGYVLVAANLSRYPRCSVVETSLGKGKVYDTGGFAETHKDGFDLATDWSNNDGS